MSATERACVLVLADGAAWEPLLLAALERAGVLVLRRCVDLADLVAAASARTAGFALVSAETPDLDLDVVVRLLRYGLRILPISSDTSRLGPGVRARLDRLGLDEAMVADPDAVLGWIQREEEQQPAGTTSPVVPDSPPARGKVVAVWGPTGAPGRTTVAVNFAALLAGTRRRVTLMDLDPYGGAVAQHLGLLEEVSGLLAAGRLANAGTLDPIGFDRCCRLVGDELAVLTGLPRSDRRVELRPGTATGLIEVAAQRGDVVVDCGFGLDGEDPRSADRITLDVLEAADEVVVVGGAEPNGLARLARGLIELGEILPGTDLRVVINRMRRTLGWDPAEVVAMVEGYGRPLGVHLVPEDRTLLDRALVAGCSLSELGDSAILSALAEGAAGCFPGRGLSGATANARRRGRRSARRRRAGRAP